MPRSTRTRRPTLKLAAHQSAAEPGRKPRAPAPTTRRRARAPPVGRAQHAPPRAQHQQQQQQQPQPRDPFEFVGDEAEQARRASAAAYGRRTSRLKRSILTVPARPHGSPAGLAVRHHAPPPPSPSSSPRRCALVTGHMPVAAPATEPAPAPMPADHLRARARRKRPSGGTRVVAAPSAKRRRSRVKEPEDGAVVDPPAPAPQNETPEVADAASAAPVEQHVRPRKPRPRLSVTPIRNRASDQPQADATPNNVANRSRMVTAVVTHLSATMRKVTNAPPSRAKPRSRHSRSTDMASPSPPTPPQPSATDEGRLLLTPTDGRRLSSRLSARGTGSAQADYVRALRKRSHPNGDESSDGAEQPETAPRHVRRRVLTPPESGPVPGEEHAGVATCAGQVDHTQHVVSGHVVQPVSKEGEKVPMAASAEDPGARAERPSSSRAARTESRAEPAPPAADKGGDKSSEGECAPTSGQPERKIDDGEKASDAVAPVPKVAESHVGADGPAKVVDKASVEPASHGDDLFLSDDAPAAALQEKQSACAADAEAGRKAPEDAESCVEERGDGSSGDVDGSSKPPAADAVTDADGQASASAAEPSSAAPAVREENDSVADGVCGDDSAGHQSSADVLKSGPRPSSPSSKGDDGKSSSCAGGMRLVQAPKGVEGAPAAAVDVPSEASGRGEKLGALSVPGSTSPDTAQEGNPLSKADEAKPGRGKERCDAKQGGASGDVKADVQTPPNAEVHKASFPKRVRFSEPDISCKAVNKVGLLGVKRRRRRTRESVQATTVDISAVCSENGSRGEGSRQMILDELQYLLDGIFKTLGEGKALKGMSAQLVTSSLTSLARLFLRKSNKPAQPADVTGQECGVLLQILAEQPKLLKTIVNRLFSILGKSRTVDVLVSLVLTVIFQARSQILLVDEDELDSMLTGLFRNSAASLKQDESQPGEKSKDSRPKQPIVSGRRGLLGRRLAEVQQAQTQSVLKSVNELVIAADIVGEDFKGFRNETDGSVFLMGTSLAMLLERQEQSRRWMRQNRRLDRVVAVLYSCEKIIALRYGESEGKQRFCAADISENRTTSVVMGASMRILEFATLDSECQRRVSEESKVGPVVLDIIKRVVDLDEDIHIAEPILCSALRLSINLSHRCEAGAQKFAESNGLKVVMDCLARECKEARLVAGIDGVKDNDVRAEMFDVRVLCLALLGSIVYEDPKQREIFRDLRVSGVPHREGGAIAVMLELLKNAGKETMGAVDDKTAGEVLSRRPETSRNSQSPPREGDSAQMERKITVGYCCLLLGALVNGCRTNRELVEKAMPGQTMLGVAAVLDEFLDFHHEVGVVNADMDGMYRVIIESMTEGVELEGLVDAGGGAKGQVEALEM